MITLINGGYAPNIHIRDEVTGKTYKLGKANEITLTPDENNEIRLSVDRVLTSPEPLTIQAVTDKTRLKAFAIFALTGNDLYLRFPKKLRRRKRNEDSNSIL